MAGNTFGHIFRLTTFGESHGEAIGGIIDGCPPNVEMDYDFIQKELDKRKPGQSIIVSQRKEEDKVHFLSGIFEGKTTGTPIAFIIYNKDQNSDDYCHLKDIFRPSHADFTYSKKYGIRDYKGSGRASARETVARVVGGAIAQLILKKQGINVFAYVSQVGDVKLEKNYQQLDLGRINDNIIRCPDKVVAKQMQEKIEEIKQQGDSIGGIITGIVLGLPIGLGEPVFDKLSADLAKAMLSINAAKGFDYGAGFEGVSMKGSGQNDRLIPNNSQEKGKKDIEFLSNYSGGIQGGISNGQDVYFRVAFKPPSTIMKKQKTVNISGEEVEFEGKGRHDPCVLPRAVSIVEAMASLVLVDHLLRSRTIQ